MSVVHETLKVNDELSIEVDVIYENGEKYVQENTIQDSVNGKRKPWDYTSYCDSIGGELKIPTEPPDDSRRYGPIQTNAGELYKMEYMNALSYQINQEYYFDCIYKYEDDEDRVKLWNLWYDVNVEKLVSTWKSRYNNFKMEWYNLSPGPTIFSGQHEVYHKDIVLERECFISNDENVLFPFNLTMDDKGLFIHFDVFLFLLYIKFPQYKTDIMRFLKYQPVCTKTSDELFIYNLKQTNKDLLKQLNEANHKLSTMNELEIKLKSYEETLSKRSSEIEELKKQVQDKEKETMKLNESINKLNETIVLKEKMIEELSGVEDENKVISNELSSIKESLENEKLKTSQWKSKYIQLKEIIVEHAQRTLKELGDD